MDEEFAAHSYDDNKLIKRNTIVSNILIAKAMSTLCFNVVGIYDPDLLDNYAWILFMEAFHHYHARIFYLLALHRNMNQLYGGFCADGRMQHRLIMLETTFDIVLIALYIQENYQNELFSTYLLLHTLVASISLCALSMTSKVKVQAIA